jgi:3-isopropylmalate/(R)-2-methylmalate dehydratase small subunit
VLADLGVAGILAETINGLFLRNCVNAGLPAIEVDGVAGLVQEGDVITVDYSTGRVTNDSRSTTLQGEGLPPELIEIVQAGGILARLRKQGYIA